jgi:hypothetical protein
VIIGDIILTSAKVTLLTDWTNAGGTLIALKPDAKLAGLLGLTIAPGTLSDKLYLQLIQQVARERNRKPDDSISWCGRPLYAQWCIKHRNLYSDANTHYCLSGS